MYRCASCIAVCPTMAMFIDFGSGERRRKMAEYAWAALKGKEQKRAFINFAVNINKECDCWGWRIRASPLMWGYSLRLTLSALIRRVLILVNSACGKDIFKSVHPDQDGGIQLRYAEKAWGRNARV